MTASDIHQWYVALHHRTNRGDGAHTIESVGVWLRRNAALLLERESDDWIPIAIAPTSDGASELLERFQEDMNR